MPSSNFFVRAITLSVPLLSSLAAVVAGPVPVQTTNECKQGHIRVQKVDTGSDEAYGYVSAVGNTKGVFTLVPTISNAAVVTDCSTSEHSDAKTLHSDAAFTHGEVVGLPFGSGVGNLGFTQGVDGSGVTVGPDIGHGSSNYLFLADVAWTAPKAIPQLLDNSYTRATKVKTRVESQVWKSLAGYDDHDRAKLEVIWTNTDESQHEASILLHDSSNTFFATGDVKVFLKEIAQGPTDPYTEVEFYFEAYPF